jgi:SAM-dependent methyltransferase
MTVTTAPVWLERLRCPQTKIGGLTLSEISESRANALPENGYVVCQSGSTVYDIREGIMDFTPRIERSALTVAGWSNHFFPTPQLYERIWRKRALTLLTGENFPVTREMQWLREWTDVQAGEAVIDLGTSTGLYARGLSETGATIFAVDLAMGMLREAQKYVRSEKRDGIVLMRAAAENLPFHDASIDAVVVGGSLNEMQSMRVAMQEAYRVVRAGGRMVIMSLSRAYSARGRSLQKLAGMSGIQFPTVAEFNTDIEHSGWKIARQELKGIVLFSQLVK